MTILLFIFLIAVIVYFAFKIDSLEMRLRQADYMMDLRARQLSRYSDLNAMTNNELARVKKELSSIIGENS